MPLENTFRDLTDALRRLRDNVAAVQLTAREDAPAEGSVMAVDALSDAVDDALGWVEESLVCASAAQAAVGNPPDFQRARLQLARGNERFHCFRQKYSADLVSYERLYELMAFSKRRSGEWQAWAQSVRRGLDECGPPIEAVSRALLDCWQELAERTGGPSVSVQNNLSRLVAQRLGNP